MNPATSTRWNAETSIVGRIGVSIGISEYEAQAAVNAATAALLSVLASRAVIDFPEELVILFDKGVARLELHGLFVGATGLAQFALVLVRNCQIVLRRRVGGVQLRRALPSVDGLAPQSALRDGNPELHLLFRVTPCVRLSGPRQAAEKHREGQR